MPPFLTLSFPKYSFSESHPVALSAIIHSYYIGVFLDGGKEWGGGKFYNLIKFQTFNGPSCWGHDLHNCFSRVILFIIFVPYCFFLAVAFPVYFLEALSPDDYDFFPQLGEMVRLQVLEWNVYVPHSALPIPLPPSARIRLWKSLFLWKEGLCYGEGSGHISPWFYFPSLTEPIGDLFLLDLTYAYLMGFLEVKCLESISLP